MYSSRLFDWQQVLFPQPEKELTTAIGDAEKVVAEFNGSLGGEKEQAEPIDLERVRQGLTVSVARQVADLVALAKEEALGRL